MLLFLGGILLFIVLERLIRWRHMHRRSDAGHQGDTTAEVLLWGDALHWLVRDAFQAG